MFITRNVVRYVILSYCIALRTVSFKLKKRFPSLDHLVFTGVMREDELSLFRQLDDKVHILFRALKLLVEAINVFQS